MSDTDNKYPKDTIFNVGNDVINTLLCKKTVEGRICEMENCTFAHSTEELKPKRCLYFNCNHVKKINGKYENANNNGFICRLSHSGESKQNFIDRVYNNPIMKVVVKNNDTVTISKKLPNVFNMDEFLHATEFLKKILKKDEVVLTPGSMLKIDVPSKEVDKVIFHIDYL